MYCFGLAFTINDVNFIMIIVIKMNMNFKFVDYGRFPFEFSEVDFIDADLFCDLVQMIVAYWKVIFFWVGVSCSEDTDIVAYLFEVFCYVLNFFIF